MGDSGSLTNIREENLTVGDLFRAAFVNMAENYYASALRLSPGQAWRRLVFSGGLPQKLELLRRLIAEKFQREYRLCPDHRRHPAGPSRPGVGRERAGRFRAGGDGTPSRGLSRRNNLPQKFLGALGTTRLHSVMLIH